MDIGTSDDSQSSHPVAQSDLDFLTNPSPDAPSPYRGVYPDGRGKWQARVFKRRLGGRHPSPREAAKAVVRWWRARYGDRWREVWSYRQSSGATVLKVSAGFWGVAELVGEAVVVIGVAPDGQPAEAANTPGCSPYPFKSLAILGVSLWAGKQFGGEAKYRVRRVWCPSQHSHGRVTPVPVRG